MGVCLAGLLPSKEKFRDGIRSSHREIKVLSITESIQSDISTKISFKYFFPDVHLRNNFVTSQSVVYELFKVLFPIINDQKPLVFNLKKAILLIDLEYLI